MNSIIQTLSGGLFQQTVVQTLQSGVLNLAVANPEAPLSNEEIHKAIAVDILGLSLQIKPTAWLERAMPVLSVVSARLEQAEIPEPIRILFTEDRYYYADKAVVQGLKVFLGDCLMQAIGGVNEEEKDLAKRIRDDFQDTWAWSLYADKISSTSEERAELIKIADEIRKSSGEEKAALEARRGELEKRLERDLYKRLGLEDQEGLFPFERGHVKEMTLGEGNLEVLTRLLFCDVDGHPKPTI